MSNGLLRTLQAGFLAAVILGAGATAGDGAGPGMPAAWHEDRLPVLRSQKDASRERGWMLTPRGVVVVDYKARGTSAFVHLPQWVWAGEAFMCPPDLALGPKGEALITSNVIPSLWRIDPVSLRVTKHDLALDAHTDKDVGFTGLTYAAELGVFIAISDFGALWRIDPLLRRAQQIALDRSIRPACGLLPFARNPQRRSRRLFAICVQGGGQEWSVHFAPDQRSAYVRQSCND